jgi:hypothetical protein
MITAWMFGSSLPELPSLSTSVTFGCDAAVTVSVIPQLTRNATPSGNMSCTCNCNGSGSGDAPLMANRMLATSSLVHSCRMRFQMAGTIKHADSWYFLMFAIRDEKSYFGNM